MEVLLRGEAFGEIVLEGEGGNGAGTGSGAET